MTTTQRTVVAIFACGIGIISVAMPPSRASLSIGILAICLCVYILITRNGESE